MPGFEWDWLAVDQEGHVAIFSTAGFGAVPVVVFEHEAEMDAALDAVHSLPSRGGSIPETTGSGDYRDWYDLAAQGLYVYDWQHWDGPYKRQALPTNPIRVSELPRVARAAVLLTRFPTNFSATGAFAAPEARNSDA